MTGAEFDVILEQRIVLMRHVLGLKAGEYASNKDRLHNFKEAAALCQSSPPESLMGMLVKHWVSIMDLVQRAIARAEVKATSPLPEELINEKIGDAINYLVLLEAILKEKPNV